MATIYNLTNSTNATSIYQVTEVITNATGHVAGTVLLLVIWLIAFISMKGWRNKDAFAASTFPATIISILFFFAGLIPQNIMLIFILMGTASVVMLIARR